MKSFFYYSMVCLVLAACNSNVSEEKHTGETVAPIDQPTSNCYVGVSGKDSVVLNYALKEDKIAGTLSYKFYEKDSNVGSFDGVKKGDTLIANYSFKSEGQTSIRQVAFLEKDSQLQEGYGDVEEKDGKMQFKSTGDLKFGEGFKLDKVACK